MAGDFDVVGEKTLEYDDILPGDGDAVERYGDVNAAVGALGGEEHLARGRRPVGVCDGSRVARRLVRLAVRGALLTRVLVGALVCLAENECADKPVRAAGGKAAERHGVDDLSGLG